jgi:hypothetical protein
MIQKEEQLRVVIEPVSPENGMSFQISEHLS